MNFSRFFPRKKDSSEVSTNNKSIFPKELSLLPLRNSVMFPNTATSIVVGREKTLKQISEAQKNKEIIGVISQKDETVEDPSKDDIYTIGTAVTILRVSNLSKNNISVTIQGLKRFKIKKITGENPYFTANVEYIDDSGDNDVETDALFLSLKELAGKAAALSKNLPGELAQMIHSISNPGTLADLVSSNLSIGLKDKQKILETSDIKSRLRLASLHINRELQALQIADKIRSDVVGNVTKAQKEFYLKEQLKAIKKELGQSDDDNDISELEEKIKEAELPDEALQEARKELNRLSKMHSASAEYTVSRTYIEWLADIPWNKYTDDNLELQNVKKILDEDHYNLEKPKKRIIEYLAVKKLKPEKKGPILCFSGPPGVGKTSLGRSIARALGRKFIRVSLGGIRDEAEIRGHRKTYVGAMPGRIIQGIKRSGAKNPVFMLDEIDKLGTDFRGDPSSALLEVLDPEQNFAFSDHYLSIPFDLSKVMFIATANVLESIPPVLLDRMEVLSIPGYSEEEKTMIAGTHIIPKQIDEHGLVPDNITFEDKAIVEIIRNYTRESGLRNLEREIATICRVTAVDKAEGKDEKTVITPADINKYLGAKKFFPETVLRITRPGIATGLSWTSAGGEIIFIEASQMPGKGNLILTGQLGDVMKESASAALTFIRSQSEIFGISEDFYKKSDIHIHVPAGAIPKDGPSAGITIFTALLSLLTDKKVKKDAAMTGEITLRGTVLPVGGIKEKVLAAKRAGIKTIIIPSLNKKDVEELSEKHLKGLEFFYIQSIEEAVEKAFLEDDVHSLQKGIYV